MADVFSSSQIIQKISVVIGLIVLQLTLGKKASYPYGVVIGLNLFWISGIVIFVDLCLMLVIDKVLASGAKRLYQIQFVKNKSTKLRRFLNESKLGIFFKNLGTIGVITITAFPFSGGVWSGTALSKILNLSRNLAILLISIGVVIGALIFHLASMGIIAVV